MKVKVYSKNNELVGEIELADKIFARPWNADLVHQVLVSIAANRRKPWAHAKARSEVRGGGKKPWAQKGTGRARHGSSRSPIWVGGGVTFGPLKEKDYSKKINKKMTKAALYSALSKKLNDGELKVIDGLKAESIKTKEIFNVLKHLNALNALIIPQKDDKLIFKSSSNLPKVKCASADSLSVEDVLKYKSVLIDKDVVNSIK